MVGWRYAAICVTVAAGLHWTEAAAAQEMPSDYKAVVGQLGKAGDFKDGVPKVTIPRNDLQVTINKHTK